jgi:hypothetical protein
MLPTAARCEEGVAVSVSSAFRVCRICFSNSSEDRLRAEQFLSPCSCSGTSKWVHRDCLDRWRAAEQRPDALTHCSECRSQYLLRAAGGADELAANRARYWRLVARDTVAAVFLVLCAIAALCGLWSALDARGLVRGKLVPADWPAAGVALLLGLTTFLVLVALLGLCDVMCCRPQPRGRAERTPVPAVDCNRPSAWGDCAGGCVDLLGECDSSNDDDGNKGEGAILFAILMLIFAVIGAVFFVVWALAFMGDVHRRHNHQLERKSLTGFYIVCDSSCRGLEHEHVRIRLQV